MKVAMLSPVAWRTPPRNYGPWESVTSLLTEELVKLGCKVTLFATVNSETSAELRAVCPEGYEENTSLNPKVMEYLHISNCMESAADFDIIHNHFDFMPLGYSRLTRTPMLTTIHGFSSPEILPVYRKYDRDTHYVSISYSNRHPSLRYIANVYHGIDTQRYRPVANPQSDYLLFMGRIHPDKAPHEAIRISKIAGIRLILAGIVQDKDYFEKEVRPHLGNHVEFIGSVGGEEKNLLLQNAFCFLHPIAFDEPFGLSVVESIACGTPVIAYKRGSMAEIIRDGKTGFLVEDIPSAVEQLRNVHRIDRTYCHQYIRDNFSGERMAKDYIRVYESVLRNGLGS